MTTEQCNCADDPTVTPGTHECRLHPASGRLLGATPVATAPAPTVTTIKPGQRSKCRHRGPGPCRYCGNIPIDPAPAKPSTVTIPADEYERLGALAELRDVAEQVAELAREQPPGTAEAQPAPIGYCVPAPALCDNCGRPIAAGSPPGTWCQPCEASAPRRAAAQASEAGDRCDICGTTEPTFGTCPPCFFRGTTTPAPDEVVVRLTREEAAELDRMARNFVDVRTDSDDKPDVSAVIKLLVALKGEG